MQLEDFQEHKALIAFETYVKSFIETLEKADQLGYVIDMHSDLQGCLEKELSNTEFDEGLFTLDNHMKPHNDFQKWLNELYDKANPHIPKFSDEQITILNNNADRLMEAAE